MKILLFSRADINLVPNEVETLFGLLAENGLDYMVNRDFAAAINAQSSVFVPADRQYGPENSLTDKESVMVSYGGDGTFLDAVRLLAGTQIPIVGINFGHLGFLANVPKEDMSHMFAELKNGMYEIEPRSMLGVKGDFDVRPDYPYAFNEFTVQRKGLSLIYLDVRVNGDWVATYRADGVIVSTPSGSTAYSLSAGGPILAPDCSCMVISPIAPHNLTMRPIVVPDSSTIEMRLSSRDPHAYASLDNRSFDISDEAAFTITKASRSVLIARMQNISFYDTLRNKMMWGLDGMSKSKRS